MTREIFKYKVKVNSESNLEVLLQETYDLAEQQVKMILDEMNKLRSSTDLKEELLENKVKYEKAMHDFLTDRDKAIGRKIEIAKLLGDILKNGGDLTASLNRKGIEKEIDLDFGAIRKGVFESEGGDNGETYHVR